MLEGSVELCPKNILIWVMKGQTHFGMPRGAKMSIAINQWHRLLCIPLQTLPLSMHHKWEEMIDFVWKLFNEISQRTYSRPKVFLSQMVNLFIDNPLKGIECHYTSQTKDNLEVASLSAHANWEQCPWGFLGIVSRDPRVSESNWLHGNILQFFFINLGYIL